MQIDHTGSGYAAAGSPPAAQIVEPSTGRQPRVAIAHEWLTIPGGSEKVVCAMLELLPTAEVFTSVCDPERWSDLRAAHPVHASFLDRIPGARERYAYMLPLMDPAFRSFDLSGFDLVISSNHASAKSVRAPAGVPHVCYCHTPMRYAWDAGFLEHEPIPPLVRPLLTPATEWLRRVDRRRSAGPDVYVANSSFVQARIERVYGRASQVIHPPVEIAPLLEIDRAPEDAYLVLGRVVPYKRVDLAVQACRRLGRRLIVAGTGRDLARVRALASDDVEFLGHVPDGALPGLLSRARALLFPGLEDFGIVPVEAQAAGVPVIAYGEGGVRDSVLDGRTGVLYPEPTVEGLVDAIRRFESLSFDTPALRRNAERFAPERFRHDFATLLSRLNLGVGAADTIA